MDSKFDNPLKRIYVGNIPRSLSEDDLINIFCQAGHVLHILLFKSNTEAEDKWNSEGECVIMYETEECAKVAVEIFDEMEISGSTLEVHIDDCSLSFKMFRYMSRRPPDESTGQNER
jgi:RNA recognition motif-containing protein